MEKQRQELFLDSFHGSLVQNFTSTGGFESSMECYISWSGTSWFGIWSVERNGMAGKRSIHRLQVAFQFVLMHPRSRFCPYSRQTCVPKFFFKCLFLECNSYLLELIIFKIYYYYKQRSRVHFSGEPSVFRKNISCKILT